MKFELFTPIPIKQPPPEVTLTLSVQEALILLRALGVCNVHQLSNIDERIDANNVYTTYDKFIDAMSKAGLA
jgi:hypothetical protein